MSEKNGKLYGKSKQKIKDFTFKSLQMDIKMNLKKQTKIK